MLLQIYHLIFCCNCVLAWGKFSGDSSSSIGEWDISKELGMSSIQQVRPVLVVYRFTFLTFNRGISNPSNNLLFYCVFRTSLHVARKNFCVEQTLWLFYCILNISNL